MSLPKITNINMEELLDTSEFVLQTAEQIMKDFGMFGVEITFSGEVTNAYQELHQQLETQIDDLAGMNQERLKSIHYQVDIGNKEISQAQSDLPHYSFTEIIAHQVIARELKKVLTRNYFKTKGY